MRNFLLFILICLVIYLLYQYYYIHNNNPFFINFKSKFLNSSNNNSSNNNSSNNNSSNNNCEDGVCKINKKSIIKPLINNNLNELDELNTIDFDNIDINNNLDFNIDTEDLSLTENTKDIINDVFNNNNNTYVYFDIMINNKYIGKIIIELFEDIVPKTVNNFKYLCENKYKNSIFHRIIKGFCIQGGDYMNGDGTFSNSIYGDKFDDENFNLKHDKKYLLSMANSGPNTNGSQFFITLNKLEHLDNKHVVFGRVLEESYDIIDQLGNIMTNENDKPLYTCKIVDSGIYKK